MTKFKELSKLSKSDVDKRLKDLRRDLVKAKVTVSKGGKVKIREIKKNISRLLMLKNS